MSGTADDRAKVAELVKKFRFAMFVTNRDDALVAHPLTVQEAGFDGDRRALRGRESGKVDL